MLMCWNEEPQRRPKFTELRSKFDAMLLAENKDPYIDLRIDNEKPYYRLDTMATMVAKGLQLPPNPSRHSFTPSTNSASGDRLSAYDCSLKPKLSPCHKSQESCCSSAQTSPRKPAVRESSVLSLTPSPCHDTCESTNTASNSEMRVREDSHDNRRRPISLLLPHESDRRERQNPYVDEPSRLAVNSLALSSEHNRRGSDGAIELNHLRSWENPETEILITITGD